MATIVEVALKNIPDDEQRRAFYRDAIGSLDEQGWVDLSKGFEIDQVYDDLIIRDMFPDRYDPKGLEEEKAAAAMYERHVSLVSAMGKSLREGDLVTFRALDASHAEELIGSPFPLMKDYCEVFRERAEKLSKGTAS